MSGSNITEKYEYKTDIITSYDGHEQRIKTRQEPRRFFSYSYDAMNMYQAQWLRGLGRIRQSDAYYIPMWQAPIYLAQPHYGGKALYVQKEYLYNLKDCQYIELFVTDDVNRGGINLVNQIVDIQETESDIWLLGLKLPIKRHLNPKNTWIFPLRNCSIQPSSSLSYMFSNGTSMTHNFEDLLQKPVNLVLPSKIVADADYKGKNRWNLPKYIDSKEVLQIEPTWADDESVKLSMDKNVSRLDNETGIFVYDLKNVKSYDIHTYQYTLLNQEMIHNMIRFFRRISGMWKSFYYPTWVNDLQVVEDITANDNYIIVGWNKISQYYVNNRRSKKIVIFTKDWKSYIFDVITYSDIKIGDNTYGKVVLSKSTAIDLNKENILMVSYLNLVRLDHDDLQLNYETNVVANTTLTMKEVDDV